MNRYIVVNSRKKAITNYMFRDLTKLKNVIFFEEINSINNKFVKVLEKIFLSYKLNHIFNVPFRDLFNYKYSVLNNVEFNKIDSYYIFVMTDALNNMSIKLLKKLQNEFPNIKYVLILLDPIESNSFALKYAKSKIKQIEFEKIFTFQKEDAEKYNYEFCMDIYSKIEVEDKETKSTDAYFCGMEANRRNIINNLAQKFEKEDVKSIFEVVGSKKSKYKNIENSKYKLYHEVIKKVKNTNCIIEILQKNQTGSTLRYYEAICYNKKLLTNNKNIVNLPFYDNRYIKIFDENYDIDYEWIKKHEDVDYKYDGRFSPLNLI